MQTTFDPPRTQRISALDFTKGTLVLIMVLYHWINYFVGSQWGYYQYLRFLTPSFIFITGFMISHVYLSKYDLANGRLSLRLFERGIKLIVIFLTLNIARILIAPALSTGTIGENLLAPGKLFIVFVTGNLGTVNGKLISFSILLPISYLLILSGLLIRTYRQYKYTFHIACVVLLGSVLLLGITGKQSQNLEHVTIGMLGALIGFVPITTLNKFVSHPALLVLAYLCYTISITIWGVSFPFQLVGVPLSVGIIYLIGTRGSDSGKIRSEVILLGKYSLFGYISQIAALQILSAGFHHVNAGLAVLFFSFLAAFALTIASVEILDRARARTVSVDRLYRAVFA